MKKHIFSVPVLCLLLLATVCAPAVTARAESTNTPGLSQRGNAADSVTFAYMGDVQPQSDMVAEYAAWGELAESVYTAYPNIEFVLLGGDIVNSGISQAQFDCFLQNASQAFGDIPLYATAGNHESNFPSGKPELMLEIFEFPQNGPEGFSEEFYSFDRGNVHITVLNSWIFSGEQKLTENDFARIAEWLKTDLASSDADWQVVMTHLPVYPLHADTNADKMREAWGGIFEEYGVDLVLVGHQHVYSRSYPLTQGKIDYENGITYIMSVSGSKFYSSADETLSERTVYGIANCQIISTKGDSLTVLTLDSEGNELDFVTLTSRSGVQTRLAYVTGLWKKAGSPEPKGTTPFTDADSPAATWAYENGLFLGYGNGISGANDIITQWQIDLITARTEANK